MLPQPQNSSAIYNGKVIDTWAKLPQAHMCMKSEQILIVSKIIVIKHHTLTMDKS